MNTEHPSDEIRLLYRPGMIAIRGASLATDTHRHHALQVAASTGGLLQVSTGRALIETALVVIPPDVDHSLVSNDCLILLLEPEGVAARAIMDRMGQSKEPTPYDAFFEPFLVDRSLSWAVVHALLKALGAPLSHTQTVDKRLGRVINWIDDVERQGAWGDVSFSRACAIASLSEGRFRHLMSEQFGIGWRAYVRWKRLLSSLQYAVAGGSLTDAALHAGFADQSHLIRVCREMFGMTPGDILRRGRDASTTE